MFKDGRVNVYDNIAMQNHMFLHKNKVSSNLLLDQPPHCPELAPSDFYLFWYLRLNDFEEVKTAVLDWASSQAAGFFHIRIQILVEQYGNFLNKN